MNIKKSWIPFLIDSVMNDSDAEVYGPNSTSGTIIGSRKGVFLYFLYHKCIMVVKL